jgi:hypothetical protein
MHIKIDHIQSVAERQLDSLKDYDGGKSPFSEVFRNSTPNVRFGSVAASRTTVIS